MQPALPAACGQLLMLMQLLGTCYSLQGACGGAGRCREAPSSRCRWCPQNQVVLQPCAKPPRPGRQHSAWLA